VIRALILVVACLALACAGVKKSPPAASPLTAGVHRFDSSGVTLAYHVAGSGPVVIAHPGGPGCWWTILPLPALEAKATVVTLEPVGTGASGRLADPNGYTIDRYVGDVDALRAHLGLDRVVLLGHSHGGFVAQAYALAHPDHLRGLILYDTSPTTGAEWQHDVESNLAWFEHEPWFPDAKVALAQETTAATDDEMTAVFRRELPLYFAEWTTRHAEFETYRSTLRLAVAPGRSGTDPAASSQVGVAPVFEVRDRLHEIKVPTLILVGSKDFVCSPKFADVMHAGIGGSRLVVLQHSGHMGHMEEPAAFTGAIATFLGSLAGD
jgi:proline iminopeptidase